MLLSHQNLKCHPSKVNQIHSPLIRSSGKDSYRGCLSPLLHHHRRKEGSQTIYRLGRVTRHVLRHQHTPQSLGGLGWHLQYVHNDAYGPAVHGSPISLPPDNLRSCEQKHIIHSLIWIFIDRHANSPTEAPLPRYSGVPQGSLMRPFSSFASWKSLMTILECFRRLKYTKFSNWMC